MGKPMPPIKQVRFSVSLPPWFNDKLELWAAIKGTSRAGLAANILQARIEANWAAIEADLDAIAKSLDMTRSELEAAWLSPEPHHHHTVE